jgi:hypothetical protein
MSRATPPPFRFLSCLDGPADFQDRFPGKDIKLYSRGIGFLRRLFSASMEFGIRRCSTAAALIGARPWMVNIDPQCGGEDQIHV